LFAALPEVFGRSLFPRFWLVFVLVKFSVFVPGRVRQFKDTLSGPIKFNDFDSGRS
jgi:hypothetical protein